MLFWLLVLIVMASLAGLGFRQGVIRVAFSLVGILIGVMLAAPLGRLIRPVLTAVGLKNPVFSWVLAPLIIFIIISAIFKAVALAAHNKVDVYYKYKAGELRLALWNRISTRLGLCLALVNGALYLILLSSIIYNFSYWTVQLASEEGDPFVMRLLNRLGHDMQSAGFTAVARAVDPMPQSFFDAADVAGLIFKNPLIEGPVSRYQPFLSLGERPEFQDLGRDKQFMELRLKSKTISEVLSYQGVKTITDNPDTLKTVWSAVLADLADFRAYLETGKSDKYDSEPILGRWKFDLNTTMAMRRRANTSIPATEMQRLKKWMETAYAQTTLVAMTDNQAALKAVPPARPAAGAPVTQSFQGQWKNQGGKYELSLSGGGGELRLTGSISGDRLTLTGDGRDLGFERED